MRLNGSKVSQKLVTIATAERSPRACLSRARLLVGRLRAMMPVAYPCGAREAQKTPFGEVREQPIKPCPGNALR